MEWTKENVVEFIDVYRRQDILWNCKHPCYYNKINKQNAWEEVASEINRPVDECRKKMDYLLANLRREKMKTRKRGRSGGLDKYESSWFAFKPLEFLLDRGNKGTYPLSPNKSSLDENGDSNERDGSYECGGHVMLTMTAEDAPLNSSPLTSGERKRLKMESQACDTNHLQILDESADSSFAETIMSHLNQEMVEEKKPFGDFRPSDDQDLELFGQFVVASLKKLPPIYAIQAQNDIHTIISNYKLKTLTGDDQFNSMLPFNK